jgi:hypothetical protein
MSHSSANQQPRSIIGNAGAMLQPIINVAFIGWGNSSPNQQSRGMLTSFPSSSSANQSAVLGYSDMAIYTFASFLWLIVVPAVPPLVSLVARDAAVVARARLLPAPVAR